MVSVEVVGLFLSVQIENAVPVTILQRELEVQQVWIRQKIDVLAELVVECLWPSRIFLFGFPLKC
jgi:hypothetical protein